MSGHLKDTQRELTELAKSNKRVAVSYSGGKDSMVTLDLALKHFERVIPFYLYLVPGLRFDQERFDFCEARFGVKVMPFPHPIGIEAFKVELYVDPWPEFDNLPDIDMPTLDRWIMSETKTTLILTGEKKA